MNGDKAIRWPAVAVGAAVAAVVSYRHALDVVTRYGETGLTCLLLPGTVTRTYCSSTVLSQPARDCRTAPALARWARARHRHGAGR